MKSKQVWRHRCDYCKKASLNKPAMEKHEKHCTGNPNRVCRMCDLIGEPQVPLAEMLHLLDGLSLENQENKVKQLRNLVNGCPACMLTAIRNCPSGQEIWPPNFDFKAELKQFWEARAEQDRENDEYQAIHG